MYRNVQSMSPQPYILYHGQYRALDIGHIPRESTPDLHYVGRVCRCKPTRTNKMPV